jgi:hypothetical protein
VVSPDHGLKVKYLNFCGTCFSVGLLFWIDCFSGGSSIFCGLLRKPMISSSSSIFVYNTTIFYEI